MADSANTLYAKQVQMFGLLVMSWSHVEVAMEMVAKRELD
jgi:hypothetical protein